MNANQPEPQPQLPGPSPADWQRLETLFHRASGFPVEQRPALAREWCAGDPAMLRDLVEMLASDSSVESLRAAAPSTARSQTPAQPDPQPDPHTDPWLGRTLGPYQLERLLGRGGMGVVYLGRRIAGGFTQTVAIKLVGLHMRSGPALQHFLLERDALARLEHPNIARLLDGGITPDGTPYIVMEYIEGRLLNQVCDDPATPTRAKLGLMLQLCNAVAYVHRNLILHRDLKPGNVMVTDDGTVKLLDFGTLKLLGPAAAANSEMTQAGLRPVTLRYASPEHIRGETVSTSADVYSLGMVLYRLLARRLPGGLDTQSVADYLHRLQTTRLQPPSRAEAAPRPHLSRDLNREPNRHLKRDLHRDLDAIVMKAIRFGPEQRYPSAGALAADIALCLAHRPVSARRGTARYRAAKFFERHRLGIVATAAILAVLAVGLGVMRHESTLARQQQQRAEAGIEAERALAHLLLFTYFDALRDLPGSTDAQHKAVAQAVAYLDGLTHSATSPALELDSIQAYRKMGLLLGSPYEANLGDAPTALQTLNKALPLSQKLLALNPHNLDCLLASMGIQTALGQVYLGLGKPDQALRHLQPAAAAALLAASDPHANAKILMQSAAVFKTLSDTYGSHGDAATQDPARNVDALQHSGALYQAALAFDPHCCQRGVIIVETTLGELLEEVDADRAIASYQKGFAAIASMTPREQATIGVVRLSGQLRIRLGEAFCELGRAPDCRALLRPEREREQQAVLRDPIDVRARTDLIDLDVNSLDAYSEVDDTATKLDLAREYLQTTAFLLRLHPANATWQFQHADALLRLAELLSAHSRKATASRAAAPYAAEGLPAMLSLAAAPDADAATLAAASDALLALHRDPPLAVRLASRAVAATVHPSADQILTLGKAQQAAGLNDAARASAQSAIALLSAHPQGLGNAARLAQANQLLRAAAS